ncbi:ATP-binding protein [Streptomyces albidus (ex Kaewkla and Franco 2022)]|uniref:ATP-binding protein n=1 Tax=Streptomyces albidus (ex Kaewkla and Franco 2022) TaxID=722709 RepID=UPI0015EFD6CE|nr:ATP-binding protein [Streptomyces albidus (ex Kaewkla and Franco 2022)]
MRASTRPARRTARVEYTLPREAASARWARQLTTGFLSGSRTSPEAATQLDEANLVVSELVTNATRHGRGRCRLRLSSAHGTVTVEVRDDGVRLPRMRRTGLEGEGGRGIPLVQCLARRLNVTVAPGGGKTVRAVLDAA